MRAKEMIFLDYEIASKQYRLYDSSEDVVVLSRDVWFDETFGGIKEEVPTSKQTAFIPDSHEVQNNRKPEAEVEGI
jgi:hypothetical protein